MGNRINSNTGRGKLASVRQELLVSALMDVPDDMLVEAAMVIPRERGQFIARIFAAAAKQESRVKLLGLDILGLRREDAILAVNEWFSEKANQNAFAEYSKDKKRRSRHVFARYARNLKPLFLFERLVKWCQST